MCEWLAWLLRMERPGHDFSSRNLCSGGSSTADDMEMSSPATKGLLSSMKDNGDFSPNLPRSPDMNGTDFTKHKVSVS